MGTKLARFKFRQPFFAPSHVGEFGIQVVAKVAVGQCFSDGGGGGGGVGGGRGKGEIAAG